MSLSDALRTISDIEEIGGWHLLADDELQAMYIHHPHVKIRIRAGQEMDLRKRLRFEASEADTRKHDA